jgi:hypothetical protein
MNLNLLVKQFFNENEYNKISDRLVVIRQDGITLYSNYDNKFEESSIGALVSGLWFVCSSFSYHGWDLLYLFNL